MKRIIATKAFCDHQFPAPHIDSVETVIDYQVPPDARVAPTQRPPGAAH